MTEMVSIFAAIRELANAWIFLGDEVDVVTALALGGYITTADVERKISEALLRKYVDVVDQEVVRRNKELELQSVRGRVFLVPGTIFGIPIARAAHLILGGLAALFSSMVDAVTSMNQTRHWYCFRFTVQGAVQSCGRGLSGN